MGGYRRNAWVVIAEIRRLQADPQTLADAMLQGHVIQPRFALFHLRSSPPLKCNDRDYA